ncbi:FKBP-type peptidyl-prolyl cis-trans isomerase FkpA/FKBP-type peptidyl-prolyl cis-trans isomerase FklB [Archangium gephyra]|uniref:Peptidyl-prolyl cis-trans isomerase n=1 Tax=Archangium gephyra TaxID=48 RepID=A0AAC8QIM3_9BACT|nr:FKBP-type peptidyl-prolyl cis-trans isomerase [Archangium gephyra]AKJ07731.1 FKBP-type peptidyl-prolyl cis-trans isomerase FkpA precursor [Archangium gephyra]REG29484.1 FKBP-type peptidyl-prolyl cis-trans isomerase FkpA/FKBP-type peptidyl-prolyl cis-trans isomerase FklB [Archangium gephyra]
MKHLVFILLFTAAAAHAAAPATDKERDSYSIGQDLASSVKQLEVDVDVNALVQGLRDSLEGKAPLMSAADLTRSRDRVQNSMLQNRKKKRDADAAKFGKSGQDFLAKNKAEKGVVTTASGLQYQVLTPATGAKPGPTSRVVFDYKATVAGGAEFDSSASRGKPATLGVSDGIKGWAEAFQLMSVGSTYRFAVPPQLAYGDQGLPGKVPPNATVIYEITLREIAK